MFDDNNGLDGARIAVGTVGWTDEDEFVSIGTDADSGYTLIRVQLFTGRDSTKPLISGVGQGERLLCHISSGIFRIPPKGTRVYVAIPNGMGAMPCAGVIFATVEKNPTGQYNKDRVNMSFGDDVDLVIRAKSVTITDPGDRFITVGTPRGGGTPGLIFQDETGSGGTVTAGAVGWWSSSGGAAKAMLQVHGDDISIGYAGAAGMSLVKLENGMLTVLANTVQVPGGNMLMGVGPVFVPVIGGLVPPGTPSTSLFCTIA